MKKLTITIVWKFKGCPPLFSTSVTLNSPICSALVTRGCRSHMPGHAAVLPRCLLYPMPSKQPTAGKLSLPLQTISYHLLTIWENITWPFLITTKKKYLSAYMTGCQLNSSYIINNLSSPLHLSCTRCLCRFLEHSRHLYAKHDLCPSSLASRVKTNPLCNRNMVHGCNGIRWAFSPLPGKVARAEAPGDRAAGKPVGKVEEKTIRSTAPQPPTLPDTSLSKFGLREALRAYIATPCYPGYDSQILKTRSWEFRSLVIVLMGSGKKYGHLSIWEGSQQLGKKNLPGVPRDLFLSGDICVRS